MKRVLIGALTAVALSLSPLALSAAAASGDQSAEAGSSERVQHWASDHRAIMDARLGGMKEALKPIANQYPLGAAFEEAVRNADKARADDMREMIQNRERMTPVERLDTAADRMARRATEFKTISEAAKPFFVSLDDAQKRNFAMLSREMLTGRADVGDSAGTPAERGCQRIGIECNSHDVSALTGLFVHAPRSSSPVNRSNLAITDVGRLSRPSNVHCHGAGPEGMASVTACR
jgi:hypothetical protein